MAPYAGPPTDTLDLDGLRAAIRRGEVDEITQVMMPPTEWAATVSRPLFARGRRRRPMRSGPFWLMLSAGLSFMFVSIVGLSTIGVYSWLRAHGG